ncbi:MAG: CNP1-like family protein [Gammaproteobacteria bacterium]|nr:MAG: CNP1-like family protein [Gammaproteobacteria bacterium]
MDAPPRFPFISLIAPRAWLAVILAVLAFVPVAMAAEDADNPNRPDDLTPAEIAEPEEAEKPWQEQQIPLPPFPRAQDLIPLRADVADPGYNYYIDVNSVSLSADEVLRYTVIIQSPRGASNIVYEGIRCATEEIKTLAYGTRDGRFQRMADPRWTFVYTKGPLGYRTTLVELYVCDENGWAMAREAVLERLVMYDPRRPRIAPRDADAGS